MVGSVSVLSASLLVMGLAVGRAGSCVDPRVRQVCSVGCAGRMVDGGSWSAVVLSVSYQQLHPTIHRRLYRCMSSC